jgi:hypothetical protein
MPGAPGGSRLLALGALGAFCLVSLGVTILAPTIQTLTVNALRRWHINWLPVSYLEYLTSGRTLFTIRISGAVSLCFGAVLAWLVLTQR